MPGRRLEVKWSEFKKVGAYLAAPRGIWVAALFLLVWSIMAIDLFPQKLELKEGQPSPRDFKAPRGIVYESEVLTERARQEAARQVEPVYRADTSVVQRLEQQIGEIFRQLQAAINEEDEKERFNKIKSGLAFLELDEDFLKTLAGANAASLHNLEGEARTILRRVMSGAVPQDAVEAARAKMLAQVDSSPVDDKFKPLLRALFRIIELRPNLVYDVAATIENREKARNSVSPIQVTIRQDEKIVGDGEIVTAEDIEALQKLGLLRQGSSWNGLMGLTLFLLLLGGLLWGYLRFFKPKIYNNSRLSLLLGLLIVITLIFARGVTAINLGGQPEISSLVGYLVPVAAGSMLVAILVDVQLAVFVTVILGLLTGVMTGYRFQFAVSGIISGLVGIYAITHLNQRSDLARSSLYLMLANLLSIISLSLLFNNSLTQVSIGALLGIGNGLLSAVLAIGFLPFLESSFGITTAVKLLELSNPNHPLLKRLLLEAPGTYHHSILVGNLAEAAADAVGADSLLARVGAYYHDIGKLRRPYFFIENQLTSDNPHDKLSPSLSALIISYHVKDGLELAKEYRLPQVIIDIIAQHHGTTLISFFYHKAKESSLANNIVESDFRYESPKPQTKEAAIVMLADSVEAGVRSLPKTSPGRMEGFVRKIIKEKLDDGQLDASDLTLRELAAIAEAFMRVLGGIFHARVEYPETVLREMERRKGRNGMLHKQSAG
ncbi:MAG: cyclic-di-AMP phosphodiesterase PgpH [Clostridia bacterium]|nr:cyclic-di-AMP phosphodiesterase PgpH [Clostridia bacterium]